MLKSSGPAALWGRSERSIHRSISASREPLVQPGRFIHANQCEPYRQLNIVLLRSLRCLCIRCCTRHRQPSLDAVRSAARECNEHSRTAGHNQLTRSQP